jgi:hypothetical protein
LAEKWKAALSDTAKITAFGWDKMECAEVAGNNHTSIGYLE